ncbi:MAG: hypothetical protein EOP10_24935 [Proteobacteria bacterium]|nr:MAG: hypothetical protein EOP10_24935 [Pseudomonadota bacterium]
MFITETPEIEILEDKVRVKLAKPYSYAESGKTKFIDIPYMTTKQYRLLEMNEHSKSGEIEMFMTLTGMSENEIDLLSPADFVGCLGVISGFFLQLQTISQTYYTQSTALFLQRVQESLKA